MVFYLVFHEMSFSCLVIASDESITRKKRFSVSDAKGSFETKTSLSGLAKKQHLSVN